MAIAASTAASRALARGKSFLGYRETPARSNRTRFGKQYGWDGVAWCVIFVWCILQDTGTSGGVIKTASTGAMERWAKTVGRTVTTPRAGDLIILRNSKGATIHTEFVYSYSGGRLLGLGGNTSGGAGSVADGGTVAINDRTSLWKRGRIRFVRPFYGVTTDDVRTAQKAAGITATGTIDAATVAGVKLLQTAAGLTADGFPGPTTMSALALGTGGGGASVAKPVTSSKLAVDGVFGVASAKALEGRLGLKQDGVLDAADIKAWQRHEGTFVDGVIDGQVKAIDTAFPAIKDSVIKRGGGGSNLLRAVQRNLSVKPVDGYGGADLAKAMQRAINTNPGAFKKRG
ncbi:peptidoglycan-binding protein [Brachybacterium sp. NBEC-018]|uniref:peptidoglycan-binding domain-containing protein n=1 Tax=Brachybacterium sp. NBEC-018 TaxID=2996004 RepID=UPI0021754122|nr:peptidoglycan-binding domain-containing protein [Brachybacterium sp. NBEC-018]UVY83784.1 peptidoglycan-binding protein [Brachybacterium sp. NBEC-018]